jgi:ornithine decarboxylase
MSRVRPHYAIKANNDHMITKLYAHLGLGFDCASVGEIEQVLEMGVSPDRIIYAHPCKDKNSLRIACEKGVNRMTFDNEHELYKIKGTKFYVFFVLWRVFWWF